MLIQFILIKSQNIFFPTKFTNKKQQFFKNKFILISDIKSQHWKFLSFINLIHKHMRKNKGKRIKQLDDQSLRTQFTQMSEVSSPRKIRGSEFSQRESNKNNENKPQPAAWPVYRKFFQFTLNRWPLGLLTMIVTILSGIVASIFPWKLGLLLDLVSKQIDNNVETGQFKTILKDNMMQLAFITIMIAVTTFLRQITLKIFQQKISIDLRRQIYTIFIKNDLSFFQIYKTGQLISRLSSDINQAKSAISNNLTFLVRNIITIIGSIVILFMMSWKLTFIVLTIVPMYAVVTLQYTRKAKMLVRKNQDIQAQISVHIGQKFGGIQTIKAYCAQDQQIEKYMKANMDSYQVVKLRTLYEGIHTTCSNFLPSFGALLVLLYAGVRLLSNNVELSAGQLTAFILYCTNLANTTAGISNSYTNIINGTSAIQKVFQMMSYKRLVVEDVGREAEIDGSVQFNKVNFKYPQAEQSIFKGLSFHIKKGEYVAFVGQSGSGKSTITKLIQHFYRIQSGDIYFGAQNSSQLNIKNLRSQIGLVSQQATIFSGTIQSNITYGLKDYSIQELQKAAEKAGCLDFIDNKHLFPNGFQTIVGQRGVNLSGGQRQRISIARALIRKPKILIFDQATSALDSNSQHIVQKSIEQLADDGGITIIVVAHRLSTVINCDKIYVMKQGNIVEIGSHKDLIRQKGYYYTLIQKQLHDRKFSEDDKQNSTNSTKSQLPYSSPDIGTIKKIQNE